MFTEARIKLTIWYLIIIMAISIFFSFIIYRGATMELSRIERFERHRSPILNEIKDRITLRLFYINLIILGFSGAAGYFLAGRTLKPIAKMMGEQKEFISNASHELRTPLTSLKTEIEVALRNPKTHDKNILASNLEDVNKMQRLTNYLLELHKYEEGREIIMTKVDLKEIVQKAISKTAAKTDLKKSIVIGNEDALIELVIILVDNAIKYSPKGSNVSIKVRPGVIEVKDHGVGIAEEDISHIFDRFYRADKSRSKDGYGLGLSIAKNIVDLHKGKIIVKSEIGKGTIFKIIF